MFVVIVVNFLSVNGYFCRDQILMLKERLLCLNHTIMNCRYIFSAKCNKRGFGKGLASVTCYSQDQV